MKKRFVFCSMFALVSIILVITAMTIKGSEDSGNKAVLDVPKEVEPIDRKRQEEAKKKPMVALTFDDGPHAVYTEQLLELLDRYQAKATFFMVGTNMEQHPELVKKVHEKGHEIGNHSYSHPDLMSLDRAGRASQIQRVQELAHTQTGVYPRWLRPPYGSINVELVEKESSMDIALWNVDTRDWESRDPAKILRVFEENTSGNDIVLFHDIYSTSIEAVASIFERYGDTYQFVTISTLYDTMNAKK